MKEAVFFLQPFEINHNTMVADIVANDYRTADVFRKYGIGYCCGGKWPVGVACEMRGVEADLVQAELQQASGRLLFAYYPKHQLITIIFVLKVRQVE